MEAGQHNRELFMKTSQSFFALPWYRADIVLNVRINAADIP